MKTIAHKMMLVGAVLLLALAGCKREDPQKLSAVGRKVGDKVTAVMNHSNDRLTWRWESASGAKLPPLDIRVRERLLWDRDLEGSDITVSAKGTIVQLQGNVTSLEQRQHAVEIARTTQGVEEVQDLLVVPEAHN